MAKRNITSAQAALDAFTYVEGQSGYVGNDIRNLVIALMHHAHGAGIEPVRLMDRAAIIWGEEVAAKR